MFTLGNPIKNQDHSIQKGTPTFNSTQNLQKQYKKIIVKSNFKQQRSFSTQEAPNIMNKRHSSSVLMPAFLQKPNPVKPSDIKLSQKQALQKEQNIYENIQNQNKQFYSDSKNLVYSSKNLMNQQQYHNTTNKKNQIKQSKSYQNDSSNVHLIQENHRNISTSHTIKSEQSLYQITEAENSSQKFPEQKSQKKPFKNRRSLSSAALQFPHKQFFQQQLQEQQAVKKSNETLPSLQNNNNNNRSNQTLSASKPKQPSSLEVARVIKEYFKGSKKQVKTNNNTLSNLTNSHNNININNNNNTIQNNNNINAKLQQDRQDKLPIIQLLHEIKNTYIHQKFQISQDLSLQVFQLINTMKQKLDDDRNKENMLYFYRIIQQLIQCQNQDIIRQTQYYTNQTCDKLTTYFEIVEMLLQEIKNKDTQLKKQQQQNQYQQQLEQSRHLHNDNIMSSKYDEIENQVNDYQKKIKQNFLEKESQLESVIESQKQQLYQKEQQIQQILENIENENKKFQAQQNSLQTFKDKIKNQNLQIEENLKQLQQQEGENKKLEEQFQILKQNQMDIIQVLPDLTPRPVLEKADIKSLSLFCKQKPLNFKNLSSNLKIQYVKDRIGNLQSGTQVQIRKEDERLLSIQNQKMQNMQDFQDILESKKDEENNDYQSSMSDSEFTQ